SDIARTRVISAAIAPGFLMPTATYNLSNKTLPAVQAVNVYEDQQLSVTFDNAVTLGSVGTVRIYDAADDTLVDTVSLINEFDKFGGAIATLRTINTRAIRAEGNDLVITTHAGKLQAGKQYWVAFSENLIAPNSIAGVAFA